MVTNTKKIKINFQNVIIGAIASIILIQVISLLLSKVFPSLGIIKGGTAILLILAGIGIMNLFIVGTRVEQLKKNENLIFVGIIFAVIIGAYIYLPKYIPEIFVVAPGMAEQISQASKQLMGAILP